MATIVMFLYDRFRLDSCYKFLRYNRSGENPKSQSLETNLILDLGIELKENIFHLLSN